MTLRVPTAKIASVGMRKLAEAPTGQARARDAQGPRPHQAHHVVAPRPGIRGQDQFGRHRRDRRSRARPLTAPTRSRSSPTRSASSTKPRSTGCRARSRRCSADRDRGDQGDRGGARQGPAPRSEARRGGPRRPWSRKRRRKRLFDQRRIQKARSQDRAFWFLVRRTDGMARLIVIEVDVYRRACCGRSCCSQVEAAPAQKHDSDVMIRIRASLEAPLHGWSERGRSVTNVKCIVGIDGTLRPALTP